MDIIFLKSEWAYLSGAVITIFFIVDPFAVVPVYLSLTERFSHPARQQIRLKACIIATALLTAFAVTGMRFFAMFGITLPAFQIAGGLLLLGLGAEQMNAHRTRVETEEKDEGLERDDVSIFPLAMPLLAGPAAISTVILYSTEATSWIRLVELLIAVLVAMLASYLILGSSRVLFRVLGHTGLNLLTRIMGMVLMAVAVQFVINGVIEVWKVMRTL